MQVAAAPSLVLTAALYDYGVPAAILAAGLLVGLGVRLFLIRPLARRVYATPGWFDNRLVDALSSAVVLAGAVIGLYLAVDMAPLPSETELLTQRVLLVLVIFFATWVAARLAAAWVRYTAEKRTGLLPGVSLITNLARIAVLAIGLLVILQTLGVSITPIITALGVGGLAVALALQDTLANVFAGVHILATRLVRPGDFIKLESGEDGYVQDITWRNTTIRRLANHMVIVPNSKLASSITTNYYLPDQQEAVLVGVGVSYSSDLAKVERVTIEVAREVQREVTGAVPDFEPFIRYNAFADSSINFNVIMRAQEIVGQHLMRHEFIKRLHARYERDGIEIPFPQRTLHVGESVRKLWSGSRSS